MDGLDDLFSKNRRKPEEEWQSLLNDYVDDLGVEETMPGMYPSKIQNHPIFYNSPGDMNWSRLMPDDSILQLKQSDDIYEDFVNIVQNTVENLEQVSHNMPEVIHTKENMSMMYWDAERISNPNVEVERISNLNVESPDKAYLAGQIIRRLSGNINPHNPPSTEERTDAPPDDLTILVTSVNDKNLEDWLIFDIKDSTLFEDCFQQSTHMYSLLKENCAKPEIVIQNVAFDLAGANVPGSPPKERISLVNMSEQRDNCGYTDIETPEKLFKHDWGITEQMLDILGKDIRENSFHLDWTISTGIQW